MTATMHKCHSIIITGKVQDISFRNTVEHIGRSFGLPGIVFNSKDGSVKILCSGEDNVIETFTQEIRVRGVQNGAEIAGIEEQTLSVHIDLPEGFTKVSFDDEIDIGRKLDKANIFLKTGFDSLNTRFENLNTDLNTGFDSMNRNLNTGFDSMNRNLNTGFDNVNRNLNTGFNEIKIGINNLSTIMLDQNTRLDEHNIRLEAMQKEHNLGQREHNARLEAILEKLANKS